MDTPAFTDEQRLALIEEALTTDHEPRTKLALIRIALDTGTDAPSERPTIASRVVVTTARPKALPPAPDSKRTSRRAAAKTAVAKAKARNPPRGQGKKKNAAAGQTAAKLLALLAKGPKTTGDLATATGLTSGNVSGCLAYQLKRKGTVTQPKPGTWQLA